MRYSVLSAEFIPHAEAKQGFTVVGILIEDLKVHTVGERVADAKLAVHIGVRSLLPIRPNRVKLSVRSVSALNS